ncbi:hypothetical protein [uncultured Fretibacterium sp.]|uniref:hypothetical protein n=1 Tax=uncultured Fretibacterium sp. TaxID=1678694 RepID=UPI00260380AF|nr:hypothetical protein [uncultured Fretibacterium sp.]
MPMQIGLDELLSMLLARVDGLAMDSENQKSRFNIMFRILYRKGIFSEADVLDAVREEHRILKELGMLEKMPEEEAIRSAADALMLWIKGDTAAIRKSLEEYDKRLQEAMSKQQKPKIDVASAAVLNQLDRMGGGPQGGKKLIL